MGNYGKYKWQPSSKSSPSYKRRKSFLWSIKLRRSVKFSYCEKLDCSVVCFSMWIVQYLVIDEWAGEKMQRLKETWRRLSDQKYSINESSWRIKKIKRAGTADH